MRAFSKLFFSSLLTSTSTQAAVPEYVSIFRNPSSIFSSGEHQEALLAKRKVNTTVKQWQKIEWKKQSFWLPEEHFLQPMETAQKLRVVARTPLLKSPFGFSDVLIQLGPENKELRALSYKDDWVQVFVDDAKDGKSMIGWLPLFFVEPIESDKGFIYTRYNSYLFALPSGGAKVLKNIPMATRLEPTEWTRDWVKVTHGDHSGYLSINHLVTRAHFADQILFKGSWHKVKKVDLPAIYLDDQKKPIDMTQARGFKTESFTKGMVLTNRLIGYKEPSFQATMLKLPTEIVGDKAQMLEYRYQSWYMSLTSAHGPVWWKQKDNHKLKATKSATEEVLSKPIFSLATHPKHDSHALISAQGIYLTFDGEKWEQIESFGDSNLPVAISAKGHLFVGDKWSKDRGKNFQPYIRWDKLSRAITERLGQVPEALRIRRIDSDVRSSKVLLQVTAGDKKLAVSGTPEKEDWTVLTSQ